MQLTAPTRQFKEAFHAVGLPDGTKYLFDVVRLDYDGKTLKVSARNDPLKNVAAVARFDFEGEGEGMYAVRLPELMTFLKRFKDDETVSIDFGEKIEIRGAKKTSVITPERAPDNHVEFRLPFEMADGVMRVKGVPLTDWMEADVSSLGEVLEDAKVLKTEKFPFEFGEGRVVFNLGSKEAKGNYIETSLDAKTEGSWRTILPREFPHIVRNAAGAIRLFSHKELNIAIIESGPIRCVIGCIDE